MLQGNVAVHSPATLTEALGLLADGGGAVRPVAGGTDAMVKFKDGLWRPKAWVNLRPLRRELAYVRAADTELEIGALTSLTELLASPLIQDGAPLLAQAVRTIGGPQIRNMGTLGGNIATASPAGDSLPALYALDARVVINGVRELPIGQFITGPGRTALQPGELITAVRIAMQRRDELCTFEKLGLRAAHAISVASVALRLMPTLDREGFRLVRVALGAVAPTVVRVPEAEAALLGAGAITPAAVAAAAAAAQSAARPISDLRASAAYRRAMAGALLQRGLIRLLGRAVMPIGGGCQ